MSVCPVCYRDVEPVAGRCPGCGTARESSRGARELRADDDESTNYAKPPVRAATSAALLKPKPSGTSGFAAAPAEVAPRPATAPPALAAPRLVLKGLGGELTDYPLGDNNVLGRSTTASVRLADREVSRKHSQIDKEGEDYILRDLGSSNGTFLNGKRIFGPSKLKDTDEVATG